MKRPGMCVCVWQMGDRISMFLVRSWSLWWRRLCLLKNHLNPFHIIHFLCAIPFRWHVATKWQTKIEEKKTKKYSNFNARAFINFIRRNILSAQFSIKFIHVYIAVWPKRRNSMPSAQARECFDCDWGWDWAELGLGESETFDDKSQFIFHFIFCSRFSRRFRFAGVCVRRAFAFEVIPFPLFGSESFWPFICRYRMLQSSALTTTCHSDSQSARERARKKNPWIMELGN